VKQAEPRLQALYTNIGRESTDFIRGVVANSNVANLALRLEIFQGSSYFLGMGQIVDAVRLVEINVVGAEAPERGFTA